jgi:hypothetical protein
MSMSRLYGKLALLNGVIFAVVLLLIRAQPYDDHALRALLMPEDCEMPCFMGIRPGVTMVDEAVRLLQANAWVSSVEQDGTVDIRWTWSGLQPRFILDSKPGYLTIAADRQRIAKVTLNTTLVVGDFWLMWGAPTAHELGYVANNKMGFFYSLRYDHQQVLAGGYGQVCAPSMIFWDSITELYIGLPRPAAGSESSSFSDDIRSLKRVLC